MQRELDTTKYIPDRCYSSSDKSVVQVT